MLNRNLQQLFYIAEKTERLGIGLMSGTSLDGLDIALCRYHGQGMATKVKLLQFVTFPYEADFKNELLKLAFKPEVDLQQLCRLNATIGRLHGQMVLNALKTWGIDPADADFIASHGQTIYHAPQRQHGNADFPNATLQIGDADHIALTTGIITISDLRQKHVAVGGEGAPLALYGDVILGSKPGEDRILLNIGGIANFTWLPGDFVNDKIISTDTGPGNTLIDAACRRYFNIPYDEGSRIALSGQVDQKLLQALLNHPFFSQPASKSTGPELFDLAYVIRAREKSGTTDIDVNNLIATLSEFTAISIADCIKNNCQQLTSNCQLFISGGGAQNRYITRRLSQLLSPALIADMGLLGIDADAKEAMLFALLGNEAIGGEPLKIGNNPEVLMGKFSFPW